MARSATQFTFQATLLATISVEAATQAEAERKLRTVLETSDANLGFLDNAPIVVPVAIEGDLDLIDPQGAPRPRRGKGGKTRCLPLHPGTNGLINDYLNGTGHGADNSGALFRPFRSNTTGRLDKAITPDGIYKLVRAYSSQDLRSGRTRCGRRLRPTRSTTRSISPRCRNGLATPISPPRVFMTTDARGPRTARRSRLLIDRRRVWLPHRGTGLDVRLPSQSIQRNAIHIAWRVKLA